MNNQNYKWFIINLFVIMLFFVGCSIQPVQTSNWDSSIKVTEGIKCENICQMKYYHSDNRNHWIMVEGNFGNNKKYPVVLDTGSPTAFIINGVHVIENKLVINSSEVNDIFLHQKTCYIPEFDIGKVKLFNWNSFYTKSSVIKDNIILVGVPVLQKFNYIVFDNIKKKVEFSVEKDFECNQSDLWFQYPFVIEEVGDNAFLFVKIPIAGEIIELQLDTGNGGGLALTEKLWDQIQKRIQVIKLEETKELYPYFGCFNCKHGIISNLNIGNMVINYAKVSVFPNDSSLMIGCQGMLGMQYFSDSVFVLDFKHNLMWIKNSSGK